MNERGIRPYCKKPVACVAGTRGKCRLCHGTRSHRNEAIVAYHDKGARSLREVGERFGLSYQRVQTLLRDAGVTARKQYHHSHQDMSIAERRKHRTLCNKGIPAAIAHTMVRLDRAAEHALDQK